MHNTILSHTTTPAHHHEQYDAVINIKRTVEVGQITNYTVLKMVYRRMSSEYIKRAKKILRESISTITFTRAFPLF